MNLIDEKKSNANIKIKSTKIKNMALIIIHLSSAYFYFLDLYYSYSLGKLIKTITTITGSKIAITIINLLENSK